MHSKPKLGIVGAGALALQVASVFQNSYRIIGFLDTPQCENEKRNGIPVLSMDDFPQNCAFVIAVGNSVIKKQFHEKYPQLTYINLIHSSAIIGDKAKLGEGCIVFPYAVVDPNAVLGNHVFVGYSAFVGHHARISDYVTLCGHSAVSGFTLLEEGAYLGTHAITVNERYRTHCLRLGKFSVAGAGAIITHDIPDNGVCICEHAKLRQK